MAAYDHQNLEAASTGAVNEAYCYVGACNAVSTATPPLAAGKPYRGSGYCFIPIRSIEH